MGQKVNPHGFRVGVIRNWDSRWYAKDEVFGDTLVSDHKVRTYLKNKLEKAGVPKVEIERDSADSVRVFIHCAKPGMIIGRGGAEIDKLKLEIEKMIGKTVSVNVVEIKTPDLNAQLVAENIAAQLEQRVGFRRAMKLCISRTMRAGAKGIKVNAGGRLGGAEIARSEHYHEGTIPLQTLRADIDYGFAEAKTTYGRIGIKVWIYKGEVLAESGNKRHFVDELKAAAQKPANDRRDFKRGDRRNGDRRDNRQGGSRQGGFNGNRQGNFNNNNRQGGFNNRPQGARPANTQKPKEGGDK
ncbi:MAG: 30S ribosomal protein S3 [Lachnospiraceae bacterium]|nr:30S ribosomal protein S3 [Lachnospiraceae bacterium]